MTSDCESIVAIVRHMAVITTEAVLSFFCQLLAYYKAVPTHRIILICFGLIF